MTSIDQLFLAALAVIAGIAAPYAVSHAVVLCRRLIRHEHAEPVRCTLSTSEIASRIGFADRSRSIDAVVSNLSDSDMEFVLDIWEESA